MRTEHKYRYRNRGDFKTKASRIVLKHFLYKAIAIQRHVKLSVIIQCKLRILIPII